MAGAIACDDLSLMRKPSVDLTGLMHNMVSIFETCMGIDEVSSSIVEPADLRDVMAMSDGRFITRTSSLSSDCARLGRFCRKR